MSIFNTGKSLIKGNKIVPIFLTVSNDYIPYAACVIRSITQHTRPNRYYRIILVCNSLSIKNYIKLRRLVTKNCEIQLHKLSRNPYLHTITKFCSSRISGGDFYFSPVYFYRFFLPRFFLNYDKAIYLDSDTIILDDIGKLFDIDLGDKVIAATTDTKVAAVPEFQHYVKNYLGVEPKKYANSGILLMDFKKMRKMHYLTIMMDFIRTCDVDLVAPDQCAMNVILKDKILYLDPTWNVQPTKEQLPKDTKIIHFNLVKKPWLYKNADGEDVFWKVASVTGYNSELIKIRDNFSVKDKRLDQAKTDSLIKKAVELSNIKNSPVKDFTIEDDL